MREKSRPKSANQIDIIQILEILGILGGSFGIYFNIPKFYKSLVLTEKMYFLWGCTAIVFVFVTINFNNRIKRTENICDRFDNEDDKDDIMEILNKLLMMQATKMLSENDKKEH